MSIRMMTILSLLTLGAGPCLAQNDPPRPAGGPPTDRELAREVETVINAEFPEYTRLTTPLKGSISSIGSSTTTSCLLQFVDGFKKLYPEANISIHGPGSTNAPAALIAGAAQLGPMSRPMKPAERDAFKAKFGYEPTEIVIATDALAIYVNKSNPIEGLNFQQLDSIFSSTRKRAGPVVRTWGDLGVKGELADKEIKIFGFGEGFAGYDIIRQEVLNDGQFKNEFKVQFGSTQVVQSVGAYTEGIGYSSTFFKTKATRILPLAVEGNKYVLPSLKNCEAGQYPLARSLYVYINKAPNQPLDPVTREFLLYALSREGQLLVSHEGFYPARADTAARHRELLTAAKK